MLCCAAVLVSTGTARAQPWPITTPLLCKDWSRNSPEAWVQVGDVGIWSTAADMWIELLPHEGFFLQKVYIHVVQDPSDFAAVLAETGKPIPELFNYKYPSPMPEQHLEVLSLAGLFGSDPSEWPTTIYIIVCADLTSESAGQYMNIGELAYAEGDNSFPCEVKGNSDKTVWGYYVTYPLLSP